MGPWFKVSSKGQLIIVRLTSLGVEPTTSNFKLSALPLSYAGWLKERVGEDGTVIWQNERGRDNNMAERKSERERDNYMAKGESERWLVVLEFNATLTAKVIS